MIYEICKWYSLAAIIIGLIYTVAKDGKSVTDYTGSYKLSSLIVNAPMLYFIIITIQRG